MRRYIGALIFAMLVIVTFVPVGLLAEPTRGAIANLSDVGLDGYQSMSGDYSVGTHQVMVTIANTGDAPLAVNEMEFWVVIDHINGTEFMNFTESKDLMLWPDTSSEIAMGSILFPEGAYNITVNITFESAVIGAYSIVYVEEVVDLSFQRLSFVADAEYPLNVLMTPTCDILYDGNVEAWSDDVTVVLEIMGTDYESSVVVMYKIGGTPVNPGYVFTNVSFLNWAPVVSGDMEARFTIQYIDSDITNNFVSIPFIVAKPPSIVGEVSSDGVPVPDVLVELFNGETLVMSNVTDADGYYEFYDIDAGTYSLDFSYRWAEDYSMEVVLDGKNTTEADVELVLLEKGNFGGWVLISTDQEPAAGATVTVKLADDSEAPTIYQVTNETGEFYFQMLDAGIYNVTVALTGFEPYQENVTVLARLDNVATFEIDPVAFEVVEFSPPDMEPGFPVEGIVSVVFSRPLDNTTLGEITLVNLDTTEEVDVLHNLSVDMMTVTLQPVDVLDYNTHYRIQVTPYLKDVNGEYFSLPAQAEFTTQPLIVQVTVTHVPATNQADVPVTVKIVVTFSARMDVSSVEDGFKVYEDDATTVAGTISSSSDGRVYTFSPAVLFKYDTHYRVELDNTIAAVDSMYTFNGTIFSFTTAQEITTGIVKGKVLDSDGKPFTPASVKVTLTKGTVVKPAVVNINGSFTFTGISPGTWTLKVEVKDYKTFTKSVVVKAGETTNAGNIGIEDKEETTDNTWIYIVVGAIILIFVIVVIYLLMRKRDDEGAEEEGAGYGGLRRYGGGYGGYDEMAEGEFICPNCQSVVGPEEEVCGSCGAEFERDIFECPECGATIPGDAPKCPACNADFQLSEGGEEEEYLESEEEKVDDVSHDYEVDPLEDEPEYIGMKED